MCVKIGNKCDQQDLQQLAAVPIREHQVAVGWCPGSQDPCLEGQPSPHTRCAQLLTRRPLLSQSLRGREAGDCRGTHPRSQRLHEGTSDHRRAQGLGQVGGQVPPWAWPWALGWLCFGEDCHWPGFPQGAGRPGAPQQVESAPLLEEAHSRGLMRPSKIGLLDQPSLLPSWAWPRWHRAHGAAPATSALVLAPVTLVLGCDSSEWQEECGTQWCVCHSLPPPHGPHSCPC